MYESNSSPQQWGETIEAQRVQELQANQSEWQRNSDGIAGPFVGIPLTGADVFYLAAHALIPDVSDLDDAYRLLRAPRGEMNANVDLAALNLVGADLSNAHLIGATLRGARLDMVSLRDALLDHADLAGVQLRDADLSGASLRGASFAPLHRPRIQSRRSVSSRMVLTEPPHRPTNSTSEIQAEERAAGPEIVFADLSHSVLAHAQLQGCVLRWAFLRSANLTAARLDRADLVSANLEMAVLVGACLEAADLAGANLTGADLRNAAMVSANLVSAAVDHACLDHAQLGSARLTDAQLISTSLCFTQLQGADLDRADLSGARLTGAVFDKSSRFAGATLTSAHLDQTTFGGANLAVIDWKQVPTIGEEVAARRGKLRAARCAAAARVYYTLAAELRAQGLNSPSDYFNLRAVTMTRRTHLHSALEALQVGRWSSALAAYLHWQLSWFLNVSFGYRLRPLRIVVVATTTIVSGAIAQMVVLEAPLGGTAAIHAVEFSLASFFSFFAGLGAESATGAELVLFMVERGLGILLCSLLLASLIRVLLPSSRNQR